MRKIIYTRPDGGLCVVHPVINTLGEPDNFTDADAEQRAWDKLPKDAINPAFVEAEAIPADRAFREAWRRGDAGGVVIDMPVAREIHRTVLRGLRAPKLAALDVEFMRAVERTDNTALSEIIAKKDALRDVTKVPAIEAATTPEQ